MKLKTVRTVLSVLGFLLAASLLGGLVTHWVLFSWLDVLLAVCIVSFNLTFWRCPRCSRRMRGRGWKGVCPFCGAVLE